MPVQNLSYNNVIERLQAFASGHHMIAAFTHGNIDLIDLPHDQSYPAMHVIPGNVEINQGVRRFTFDVMFYDLPRAQENENEYQREVLSDCVRLAEDLIYELQNGNVLFGIDVRVELDNTIQLFTEEFSQVVSGVTLSDITIITQNDWNACEIPADYAPGGSSQTGTGTASGGVILRVNGVNNSVQNVLDLVQGTNIVIEDLGDGRVRIRATGGGGGGADWGSIGGDITDQTDLITLIGGYATDGELATETAARIAGDAANASAISTEASTRATADTALQSNIDTEAATRHADDQALQADINVVTGNLSTETTARMAGDATNAADISAVASDLATHEANTSNPHAVTKTQVGLSNVPNVDTSTTANITDSTNKRFVTDAQLTVIGNTSGTNTGDETTATIQAKRPLKTIEGQSLEGTGNIDLSKSDVGLGNVDNTSDANKPISTATQTALDAKEPTIAAGTTAQYWRGDKSWQTLNKSAVGLGNVDNTSDADKPVSTAQATSIAAKQDTLVSGTNIKTINSTSLLGSGNIAIVQAFRGLSTGITLAASSGDRFYTMTTSSSSATESVVQMSAEYAMTITEIRIRTTTTQSATGSLVFTLRKAGADTALVLTLAASAVAGVYTATGSVSIAAGDLICLKIRNNATATSTNIVQISASYT